MELRVLPKEEYDKLKETELGVVKEILPEGTRIIVVEEEEKLIGCWALIPMVHAEGIWVDPSHRGRAGIARMLINGMCENVREMGAKAVWTAALDEKVEALIKRVGGVPIPGNHFAINVQENI